MKGVHAWMRTGCVLGLVVWLAACGGGGSSGSSGGTQLAGQEKSQSSGADGKGSGHDQSGKDPAPPDHSDDNGSNHEEGGNTGPGEQPGGHNGNGNTPPDGSGSSGDDETDDDDESEPGPPAPGTGSGNPDDDHGNSDPGDPGDHDGGDPGEDGGGTDDPEDPEGEEPPVEDDRSENAGDGLDFPIVTQLAQQVYPRLIHHVTAHRYFAVWNDQRDDGAWRVVGREVNISDGVHGATKVIAEREAAPYAAPGTAHDPAGERSLVVWGTAAGDVLAQAIDVAGDAVGDAVTVANGASDEVDPVVGFDPTTGQYVVAWIETSSRVVVYTRALSRDGAVLGDPTPLTEAASGKLDLRMAADPESGRFLVVWRDYRGQDLYSIFGRMVDADGAPTSDELVIGDALGAQILPQAAFDPAHRTFLVTWSDTRRSGTYELYGQIVTSPDGLLLGDNVWIDAHGGADHALEADPSHEAFVIAYPHPTHRVYARYLGPDGRAEGDEFPVSTVAGVPSMPHAAVDPNGLGFLTAWADGREGPLHVFGRWITMDGTGAEPGEPPPSECQEFRDTAGACLSCEQHAGPLVDQACPVTGAYETHGAYVACVAAAVNALRDDDVIGGACKLNLIAPRARSSVGR